MAEEGTQQRQLEKEIANLRAAVYSSAIGCPEHERLSAKLMAEETLLAELKEVDRGGRIAELNGTGINF